MKAIDLPQDIKDMYGFEYFDFLNGFTINKESNIGMVINKDAEFTEEDTNYRLSKNGVTVILSKFNKHVATIIL